jgi:hypothetical protein
MIALARKPKLRWTKKDIAFLRSRDGRDLIEKRRYGAIAKELGRTRNAVKVFIRRHGHKFCPWFERTRMPPEPTYAPPGSQAKIEALRLRHSKGFLFFHPEDRIHFDDGFTPTTKPKIL